MPKVPGEAPPAQAIAGPPFARDCLGFNGRQRPLGLALAFAGLTCRAGRWAMRCRGGRYAEGGRPMGGGRRVNGRPNAVPTVSGSVTVMARMAAMARMICW